MLYHTKKCAILSLVVLMIASNTGCSPSKIEYVKKISQLKDLKTYEFVHNVDINVENTLLETATNPEEKINNHISLQLTGEVFKDEAIYLNISQNNNYLTDLYIVQDKLFLDTKSLVLSYVNYFDLNDEMTTDILTKYSILFNDEQYLMVDLKEYDLTSKEIIEVLQKAQNSNSAKDIQKIFQTTFETYFSKNKTIIDKKDGVYTLSLSGKDFSNLRDSFVKILEKEKSTLKKSLMKDYKDFELNKTDNFKDLTEKQMNDYFEIQIDDYITSLAKIDFTNYYLSQSISNKDDLIYFNNNIIADSKLSVHEYNEDYTEVIERDYLHRKVSIQTNSTFKKNEYKSFSREFPILAISLNEVKDNYEKNYPTNKKEIVYID